MVRVIASVNGSLVAEDKAVISILDRGFTLADGLFETMMAKSGKVTHLHRHMNRLEYGCKIMGLKLPSRGDIVAILEQVLEANQFALSTIRMTVSRGYDYKRGLSIHEEVVPSIVVRVAEQKNSVNRDVSLTVSTVRRNEGSPLSNLKTLAYADAVLARKLAFERGYDDALLLNNKGNVACATSSNFFLVKDDVVITPPLSDGVLPGIVRSLLLDQGHLHRIKTREMSIVPVFRDVDGVFITNVVTGVTNVSSVDGLPIGSDKGRQIVKQISDVYQYATFEDLS